MSSALSSEVPVVSRPRRGTLVFALGLAALAAGTAYLRLDSIGWGAPFVYHPDEHFVLQPALDIVRTGSPNPHWFQYPSLMIYAEALLVAVLHPFTSASLQSNYLINGIGPWDALPEQWPFVLAGRLLVAFFGVAGVVLLARAGERLHGSATGLLAGAFLMASALHNQSGHYLTTDVPSAAFVAACMAASAAPRPRWFLAGLLAGLAAGTKYTAGVVVLTPLLVAFDGLGSPRQASTYLGGLSERWSRLVLGVILGFLVTTPYALLDVAEFVEGLEAQRQNYFAWRGQEGNLLWYLQYLYEGGLGPLLFVLAAAGLAFGVLQVVLALARGEGIGRRLGFLVPPLFYIPWLASYPSRAERNLIIVLPFLCLAAAEVLRRVCAWLRPRWLDAAALAAAAGVVLFNALPAQRFFNQRLTLADNRTLALDWIRANLPPGTKIAREEYTPQLQKSEYGVTYLFSLARQPYAQYVGDRVEYLLASSNVYGRSVEPPYIGGESGREFYRVLFGLPLVKEWPQGPFSSGPTIRLYKVPLGPESRS